MFVLLARSYFSNVCVFNLEWDYRKDGARVTTRIRRVSGDRDLFLNELRAALQIPIPKNPREDTIRIRTGGTIEIKGNRVLEVKTWLAGLGF
jgi:hypothetical protein